MYDVELSYKIKRNKKYDDLLIDYNRQKEN